MCNPFRNETIRPDEAGSAFRSLHGPGGGLRFAAALALSVALGVARSEWKSLGPSGGDVFNLKVIGGSLFAVGGSGLWRSADGGESWTWAQSSLPYFISDLAASGDRMYAVNDGVFLSTDQGASWEPLAIDVPSIDAISMRVAQSIEVLGRFLIVGSSGGIFRSADRGMSWTRVDGYRDSTGNPVDANNLVVQGASIFANTSRGLFTSADSGAEGSWKVLNPDQDWYGGLLSMGRYLFLDGTNGLLRSSDGGRTWDTLSRLQGKSLHAHDNLLYRTTWGDTPDTPGSTAAFYLSLDSGSTWTRRSEGTAISQIAARGDSLFVSIPGLGVARSIDSGRHFEPCPIPVSNPTVLSAPGNRILAPGDKDQGDFISDDGGATWTRTAPAGAGSDFRRMAVRGALGIAVDYSDDALVSKDSGITWQPAPGGFPAGAGSAGLTQSVAIHAGAFFLAYRDGVYRSIDTGTTWTQVRPQKAQSFVGGVIFYSAGAEIHLWEKEGIFRSADTGSNWVAAQTSPAGIIRGVAEGKDGIYAVGRDGVFRSGDRGDTWLEVNSRDIRFHSLAAVEDGLLAGQDSLGMFFSQDGGANWSAWNAGLPDQYRITSVAVTATAAYIGVGNAGIWRRPLAELADATGLARHTPERPAREAGLRLFRTGSGMGIEFRLSRPGRARLEAFDYRGRRLAVLADGRMEAGLQSVMLPWGAAPAGIRIFRLRAEGKVLSRVAAE